MSGSRHYDTVAFDVRDNATMLFFARTTAAIRTDAGVDIIDTTPAKGTFKRANHRIRRVVGKIAVTMFAIWADFEH